MVLVNQNYSWKGVASAWLPVRYGEHLLTIFAPFVENLITKKLAKKTLERHIDNLWLLGGELIRLINQEEDSRDMEPLELIMENIRLDGGPYCRHLQTENEIKSFDSTCGKLYKYLKIEWMGYIGHNISRLYPPAAAISRARLTCSWPMTSA